MDDSFPTTPIDTVNGGAKRNASSPLVDEIEKRLRIENFDETSLARILRSVVVDAVSAVKDDLMKEIRSCRDEVSMLRRELHRKDEVICDLQNQVDHLEQYSRRENIRINGIPEASDTEDTENVVVKLSEALQVDIFRDNINRCHRVGRRGDHPRPIICRFNTTKEKDRMMQAKRKLKDINTENLFGAKRIYINEDLTKVRSDIAAKARRLKAEKKIEDTWTSNGVIFVKTANGKVTRITTLKELLSVK